MIADGQRPPVSGFLRLPEDRPDRAILKRILLVIALIALMTGFLYFDRDALRDNTDPSHKIGFVDVFYFNIVSLTTTGYGDITPVTPGARLRNALVVAPIRMFIWVLFLGTAYEVTMMRMRFREERKLAELRSRLHHHVIVCGYGTKGQAIVDEMLAHDHKPENIVIVEQSELACTHAMKRGLVVLRGDGSSEEILRAARIDTAGYVLIATDRDDAATLICLTVRSLNQTVQIVAAARQEENIKLLYSAGANLVIAPSVTGGRIMAAAVRQQAVPNVLEDLIMFGKGLSLSERKVSDKEAGSPLTNPQGDAAEMPIAIKRGSEVIPFGRLASEPLQINDVVVMLIDQTDVP